MKIQITKEAECGNVYIPAGEYWVALNSDMGQMVLMSGGKDIKIPATRRRAQSRSKRTQIQFYCGGGTTWSLVVSTPKGGEWIAMIEYRRGPKKN